MTPADNRAQAAPASARGPVRCAGAAAVSNYDRTLQRMPAEFLKYDQQRMIRLFHLAHDKAYLYLRFLARSFRVSRAAGTVEWQDESGVWRPACFEAAMTLYDLLCCAKDGCHLSGRYARAEQLRGTLYGANPAEGMFDAFIARCAAAPEALARACAALGGERLEIGEISYRIPVFDFLPAILQFWSADEDFPASFKLMWDENVLDFLRFETVCYAAGYLVSRLTEEMQRP